MASVVTVLGIATPAVAGTMSPDACPPNDSYVSTKTGSANVDMVPSAWGGPGVTLSISIAKGTTVGSTFSSTAGVSVSGIIASAQASVSSSIEKSFTTTVSYSGTGTISSSWSGGGYLHAGAHAYKYSWKEQEVTPQCGVTTLHSGTGRSPYHVPAFWVNQKSKG